MRSVVFFYIKTPLRVKEAGLEELIPTTWWPTHFDKEVKLSVPFDCNIKNNFTFSVLIDALFVLRAKMIKDLKMKVQMNV